MAPFSLAAQAGYTPAQLGILEKLNRRDLAQLARLDAVVAPDVWTDDELIYSPLPLEWSWALGHPKAIVVHQPAQVFGAYEYGRLVRWGPVSSGRQESSTPSGVFSLTWKARTRRSTDNAEWILNWYFNFLNARGISFHEFELPGRPASHACVRLLARDAQWLYEWGEQWRISANGREVLQRGTPIAIVGEYAFGSPAPWLSPDSWGTTVTLPDEPGRP
jgi:hypothetical protein